MNKYISYISVLMLGMAGLSSCNDNWETPPMVYPESTLESNVTLDNVKTKYWSTERNNVNTVGFLGDITGDASQAADSAIFKGRVISESSTGNIYNSIVVQGDGCALNISVRTNKLTAIPAFGQEIFVNITGMKIGNYNGLMQLGAEGTYQGQPSMTFMESADFEAKFQINGVPDASKVDTLLITLGDIANKDAATLQKYQSQLVRIDGLTFETPGQPFAGAENTNRYAKDDSGNRLNIRTSSYASFKSNIIPTGQGSVVGILSYFGTDWQLLLNDITGIIGFDETVTPDTPVEGEGDGSAEKPYSVDQVLAGATGTAWTQGFIVGWVNGKTLSDGATFEVPATSNTNLLIAATADCKEVAKCVPVQLPAGEVRSALNLQDHPEYLGKAVSLKGSLEAYFGTKGIKSVTEFKGDFGGSTETPDTPANPVATLDENFDGGTNIPAGWTNTKITGDKSWYITEYESNKYAAITGYKGVEPPFNAWLITPALDLNAMGSKVLTFDTQVNGYGSTTSEFKVFILTDVDPTKCTPVELKATFAVAPDSGYSGWANSGEIDLSAYSGVVYIGWQFTAAKDENYATWCLDNVKLNAN